MNDVLRVLQPITSSVVITALYFGFLNHMYADKRRFKNGYAIPLAYLLTVIITVVITSLRIPLFNMLRSILLIHILYLLLYKQVEKSTFIYNTVYVLSSIFMDVIVAHIFSLAGRDHLAKVLGNPQVAMIASAVYWICAFCAYKFCIYFFRKKEKTTIQMKEMLFLFAISIFEVAVIVFITVLLTDSAQGLFFIVIIFGFFAINLCFVRILEQCGKAADLGVELALAKQQLHLQTDHYRDLMWLNEFARKIGHDINKHFQVIEELYKLGDVKSIEVYRKQMKDIVGPLSTGFQSDYPILSAIFGYHTQKCKEYGIRLTLEIEKVDLKFLKEMDITAIFANLLDNAFEACMRIEGGEKEIALALWRHHGSIAIRMTNPVETLPEKDGIFYKSSKQGHKGIGMRIIKNSVEKYDGELQTEIENGIFLVRIRLPIS